MFAFADRDTEMEVQLLFFSLYPWKSIAKMMDSLITFKSLEWKSTYSPCCIPNPATQANKASKCLII